MTSTSEALPVVQMTETAWEKLRCFIEACPTEINGFGYVDRSGNNFLITDVFILEQTATMGEVEVTAETLGRHIYELVRAGEDPSRMRFQWHSHVNGRAYFSETDLAAIEEYADSCDWLISLVGTTVSDYRLRLDVFHPLRLSMPLELSLVPMAGVMSIGEIEDIDMFCRREVADKVHGAQELMFNPYAWGSIQ